MPKLRFRIRTLLLLIALVALVTTPAFDLVAQWQTARKRKKPRAYYARVGTLTARIIFQEEEETKVIGVFEGDDE